MSVLKSAVVAGHFCLDFIPNLDQLPAGQFNALLKPGHLVTVGPATFSTGGAVSNTGIALHILGIPTRLVAKVGTDPLGRVVHELVSRYDPALASGLIHDAQASTSYTVILNPPGIDRIFLHSPGANDTFCAADINFDLVSKADLFHFGYPPILRRMYVDNGEELTEILRCAKAAGVTTSLDMTYPDPNSLSARADWTAILRQALPFVDIFLPSIEEMLFMLRRSTLEDLALSAPDGDLLAAITPPVIQDIAQDMLDWGVKIVGLKLGYRGLYLRTAGVEALTSIGRAAPANPADWADKELLSTCFQVNVAGTTGSGDATIAGFLSALMRGLSPAEAIVSAVAVGACNVEAPDALSGLRSWEATMARIAAGWPRCLTDLTPYGWAFDPESNLWTGPANR